MQRKSNNIIRKQSAGLLRLFEQALDACATQLEHVEYKGVPTFSANVEFKFPDGRSIRILPVHDLTLTVPYTLRKTVRAQRVKPSGMTVYQLVLWAAKEAKSLRPETLCAFLNELPYAKEPKEAYEAIRLLRHKRQDARLRAICRALKVAPQLARPKTTHQGS